MSPARGGMEYEFLKEQFRDVKESQVRLEDKLDLLRESVDQKIHPLSEKLQTHDQQLARHSQIFSVASVLAMTGLAGIGSFAAWIWEALGGSPKH